MLKLVNPKPEQWDEKTGKLFFATVIFTIAFGWGVSTLGLPTVPIIMCAQLVNSCLVPYIATCLFLCINDKEIMHARPQTQLGNLALFRSAHSPFRVVPVGQE